MKLLLIDFARVINARGGTEKVLFSMANAMVERGYEVTVLALDNTEGKPAFFVDERVKFINVGLGLVEKMNFCQRVKRNLIFSREARHAFDDKCIDIPKAERIAPVIEQENADIIISYMQGQHVFYLMCCMLKHQ